MNEEIKCEAERFFEDLMCMVRETLTQAEFSRKLRELGDPVFAFWEAFDQAVESEIFSEEELENGIHVVYDPEEPGRIAFVLDLSPELRALHEEPEFLTTLYRRILQEIVRFKALLRRALKESRTH